MKKLIVAAALLLCAAVPGAAQEDPTPGEVAAVREFLEVTRARETMALTMEAVLETGMMGEEMPPGLTEVVREFLREHFRYEDLEPGFIRMYTDLFTEQEMRELTTFYRTPVGQRMVELTPQVAARTQQMTGEIMQEAMPELMQMIMEHMGGMEENAAPSSKVPPVRGKS